MKEFQAGGALIFWSSAVIYGLYLSAQGAEAQSIRQDVLANNLANASTTAFKRNLAIFQAHPPFEVERGIAEPLPGDQNLNTGGLSLADIVTDYSNGSLQPTGGDLDVALAGPGFLRVSDGSREFLTRDGGLDVTPQGQLVTRNHGYAVLGANGNPMSIVPGAGKVEISADGIVSQSAGAIQLGRLGLVEPVNDAALQKVGDNLYAVTGPTVPTGPATQVRQGFLEASGTNPTLEMIDLIESSRALEANVNMIKTQDEALGRLLGSLPRR